MTIKFSLIDNDYKVRANTNLDLNEKEELCRKFFRDVGDGIPRPHCSQIGCLSLTGQDRGCGRFW